MFSSHYVCRNKKYGKIEKKKLLLNVYLLWFEFRACKVKKQTQLTSI